MNNQAKEFNITKAVRLEFEKNKTTDNIKGLLSSLDYSEVSKKPYIIYEKELGEEYPRQHYTIAEETLAQNFMDCLPFEAYNKYIDLSWLKIQYKDDYPIVRASLYSQNFDMLNLLGDLGFEYSISKEADISYLSDYKRLYLNKVLNISELVSNGRTKDKDFFDNYYSLFKKGLVQYKTVTEDAHKKMNYKSEIVIDSWLFSMDTYCDNYSRKDNVHKIKDFLSNLAYEPQAEKITDDVMNQIKKAQEGNIVVIVNGKKKKQKINVLEIIENSEIIESALWSNNQNFIDKLKISLNISDEKINEKINSCLDIAISESNKEVYSRDKYIKLFKNNAIGEFVLSQSQVPEIKHLTLLALCTKSEILTYVKDNISLDSYFTNVGGTAFTYQDSITISYVINSYLKENLSDVKINKKPLFLEIGDKLLDLGFKPDMSNWKNLSEGIQNEVFPLLKNFYNKDKNKSLDLPISTKEWLSQFHLKEILKEDPSRPSNKIKI